VTRQPLSETEPRRIALIKPSALGDVVHALPVLTALRRRWPDAHITWVVNRAYEPLLIGHPDLSATLPFDRAALRLGPVAAAAALGRFARALRTGRFDLVIDLQGLLRTGLMARATGAPRRVGFANAREGAPRFYTDRVEVPDADRLHAVDRYWRIVDALGCGGCAKEFRLRVAAGAKRTSAELVSGWPRPIVAVAAGARWVTKRWPPEHFAAAARAVVRRLGGTVVFVGGADDAPLAHRAADQLGFGSLDLCGRTPIDVLAAVLADSDLVLANDTGPLHLAAALGRPVVAPYTCTLVERHGPYGQFHRTARAAIACHGSYLRSCDHLSCLPTIPPARVVPLLFEALSAWPIRRPA
jgi:lipopolysaccharide heptosyltransferase I